MQSFLISGDVLFSLDLPVTGLQTEFKRQIVLVFPKECYWLPNSVALRVDRPGIMEIHYVYELLARAVLSEIKRLHKNFGLLHA